jgi:hypothetical protein
MRQCAALTLSPINTYIVEAHEDGGRPAKDFFMKLHLLRPFFFCILLFCLGLYIHAQTAALMDGALESREVTQGQAAYFVLTAAELIPADTGDDGTGVYVGAGHAVVINTENGRMAGLDNTLPATPPSMPTPVLPPDVDIGPSW